MPPKISMCMSNTAPETLTLTLTLTMLVRQVVLLEKPVATRASWQSMANKKLDTHI